MKELLGFSVLLLLLLAVIPIQAAPLTAVEPVPCDETGASPAARLTLQHINQHHYHGYKFTLSKNASVVVKKSESECVLELQLDLLETVCHFTNPKPYEECEVRPTHNMQVMADCKATVTVIDSNANVTKYECNTNPVPAANVNRTCPDCPTLLPLTDPDGLKVVRKALELFHRGNFTQRWKLLEVGRLTSWFMFEFAIVETSCPYSARVVPEACKPICPATARYGLCSSTLYANEDLKVSCEIYEAQNSSSQGPERKCERLHYHGHEGPDHRHHHKDHHGDKVHKDHHGDKGHEGPHGHGHGHHGPPPHRRGEGGPPRNDRPGSPHGPVVLPLLPTGQRPSGPPGHGRRPPSPRAPPHCQAENIHPICSFPPAFPQEPRLD